MKSTVPDKPKCLAPVAGQPFLDFVVDHAIKNGVEHIVFCLGYMASLIESHVQERYSGHVAITIVLEEEALGTGGAIKNGAKYIKGDRFFALNGDSLLPLHMTIWRWVIMSKTLLQLLALNQWSTLRDMVQLFWMTKE
ncbi:MAG: NTP transferase domain-containing protein [Saprospiraceae bacterium]|nr:NTP transferase domain-containing protein [Saprospiraceae bacterium]